MPASAPLPLEFLKSFRITSYRLSMRVHCSGDLLPVAFRTASVRVFFKEIVFYKLLFFLIDKLGAMNVMIPFTALAGILTYAWPFAQTEASLIVVTVLYGFVFLIHLY
jgi:hypothetical protein